MKVKESPKVKLEYFDGYNWYIVPITSDLDLGENIYILLQILNDGLLKNNQTTIYFKNIDPLLNVFGNRQVINFNRDNVNGDNESALTLINWFIPKSNVRTISTLEFLKPDLKGFRFNHTVSTVATFGDFSLEKYDRFGDATTLFSYKEALSNDIGGDFVFNANIKVNITPTSPDDVVNKNYVDSKLVSNYIIGEYRLIATNVTPPKFLLCDGRAISRSTYSDLFSVIGTSFGVGNGTTTFNLPDLRQKVPAGASLTKIIGVTEGSDSQILTQAQLPTHTHTATLSSNAAYSGTGSTRYLKTGSRPDFIITSMVKNDNSSNFVAVNTLNNETFSATDSQATHSHTATINSTGSSSPIDMRQATCYVGNYFIYTGV